MSFQPTNPPHWRPEDAQLLQSLRQKAGLDELVFARTNTVSLAQLRELEQGGESSFYNPQIKRSTGVKLLRKLGHELPSISEHVRTDSLLTEENPAAQVLLPTPAAPKRNSSAPSVRAAATSSNLGQAIDITSTWMYWGLGLSTLALLAFAVTLWPQAMTNTTARSPLAIAPSDSPAKPLAQAPAPTQSDPLIAITAPSTASAVSDTTSTAPPTSTASLSPARSVNQACDWRHRDDSTVFQQTAPIKPGNYVHFVAQAETTLCVLDQDNKLTTLNLPAGSAKSVYGVAPFLVHSSGWQNLNVFFQGRPVRGVREGTQHLQLLSQAF